LQRRISYKSAGVNIEAGNQFVKRIRPLVKKTYRPEVLTDIGGFGGLFSFDAKKYKKPVLVSSTDGVGTKLKVAFMLGKHDTVGIDLVAMGVNDIVVHGAEPLFFLDYLATGKLSLKVSAQIIEGVVKGCLEAGCALIGGETAEMPSFYGEGEYDLAGFVVGVVERGRVIDGSAISPGDQLIGLSSSGLHSNGFSLVRKIIFEHLNLKPKDRPVGFSRTIGEELLTPTRIYVRPILQLLPKFSIRGMAHITGGGITDNLPRMIPQGCQAVIWNGSWPIPPIFPFLQKAGNITEREMLRTFNNGIGLILAVPYPEAGKVLNHLQTMGEKAFQIGEIIQAPRNKGKIRYL